jgi:hypothetical protein
MALGPAGLVWLGLNLASTNDITCSPTTGEVTFTGNVPVIEVTGGGLNPHPLVWLGLNMPQVVNTVAPNTATVTFTGNRPEVQDQPYLYQPTTGVVAFVGNIPTVAATTIAVPTTGVLTFTGNQATVSTAITFTVTNHDIPAHWFADVGFASRFAFMPVGIPIQNRASVATYDFTPTTGEVLFEGNVSVVSLDVNCSPNTGEMEFTGEVPTVSADSALTPETGVITFTGEIPGIDTELSLQPGTGEVTFTGNVPTVEAPADVMPETGVITFFAQTPSVDIQEQVASPSTGVVVFIGNVPTLTGAVVTSTGGRRDGGFGPGKARKERKKLLVRIDDEDFVVESVEEAETLLAQAKQVYEQQIADLGTQLVEQASKPTLEIKPVKMPRIRAEGPQGPELDALIKEVAEMRSAIRDLYEKASTAQKRYVNDDDEALALLL